MTDTAPPRFGAATATTDHLAVVYQFGKVASTTLVAALNDCPGVEAVQSHFLGEAALHNMLSSALNPALSDYYFFHQSGQLSTNIEMTRRIGRILSGQDTRTRLTVLLTVREPLDWFRSALTQDARGLGDVFLRIKDRYGLAGEGLHGIAQPAVEAILIEIADLLASFGSIDDFLLDRPKSLARMRTMMPDPSLQEIFYSAVRPFDWHKLLFQPVFRHGLDDFIEDYGLWSLRHDRFEAHLFRYEEMAQQLPRIAAAMELKKISPTLKNVSEGKVFDSEIRAAFRSSGALRLAHLYANTDYSRRFGYDPVTAAQAMASPRTLNTGLPKASPMATMNTASTGREYRNPLIRSTDLEPATSSIMVCPSCRSARLPDTGETIACPACDATFPRLGNLRDLRIDQSADTALDLDTYDGHHKVTVESAKALFSLYEATLQDLGSGMRGRVLEIGAGTGNLTHGLALHGSFSELWITDISPRFLKRLVDRIGTKGATGPIRPCLLDANALPFADDSFDLVLGHSVLHHLLDFETTLRDTYRCLRSGGAAMFGEPIMDGNALIYLIARQILTLADDGVGPSVSDGTRVVLEVISGRGGVKSANLHDRDARVATYEDKYIFPAGFLRDLCGSIGFSRVNVIPKPVQRDLGGTLRRSFLGIIKGTQARIEDLDPYLALFDAVTTSYAPGMSYSAMPPFAYLVIVK